MCEGRRHKIMLFSRQNSRISSVSCSEAVANKYPWFLISLVLGLGMKDTLEPLEADFGVSISRFRNRIVLSGGG